MNILYGGDFMIIMLAYLIIIIGVLFLLWLWISSIKDEVKRTNDLLEKIYKEIQK